MGTMWCFCSGTGHHVCTCAGDRLATSEAKGQGEGQAADFQIVLYVPSQVLASRCCQRHDELTWPLLCGCVLWPRRLLHTATRRRRGISLINSIATKYGIRLRILPLDGAWQVAGGVHTPHGPDTVLPTAQRASTPATHVVLAWLWTVAKVSPPLVPLPQHQRLGCLRRVCCCLMQHCLLPLQSPALLQFQPPQPLRLPRAPTALRPSQSPRRHPLHPPCRLRALAGTT